MKYLILTMLSAFSGLAHANQCVDLFTIKHSLPQYTQFMNQLGIKVGYKPLKRKATDSSDALAYYEERTEFVSVSQTANKSKEVTFAEVHELVHVLIVKSFLENYEGPGQIISNIFGTIRLSKAMSESIYQASKLRVETSSFDEPLAYVTGVEFAAKENPAEFKSIVNESYLYGLQVHTPLLLSTLNATTRILKNHDNLIFDKDSGSMTIQSKDGVLEINFIKSLEESGFVFPYLVLKTKDYVAEIFVSEPFRMPSTLSASHFLNKLSGGKIQENITLYGKILGLLMQLPERALTSQEAIDFHNSIKAVLPPAFDYTTLFN